jgi:trehalose-phosphatase
MTDPVSTGTGLTSRRLTDAVRGLAATPRLLVALDFDGTLAPLVDEPGASRMVPAARDAVDALEELADTWVGFVSGRSLESLAAVTESDERALLIASHGAEVRLGTEELVLGVTEAESLLLAHLASELQAIAADAAGARVEHKPAGLALHTRGLPDRRARQAQERAHAAASARGGFTERYGKDVIEFAVREETKGDGVARLRTHVGATAMLFAGDDRTDEDAFAVLGDGDVGIKVGTGKSVASFRVTSPEELASVLGALAADRARRAV